MILSIFQYLHINFNDVIENLLEGNRLHWINMNTKNSCCNTAERGSLSNEKKAGQHYHLLLT